MQSVSSRIWTRVAVSISYDDNHYTTVAQTKLASMFWYFRQLHFFIPIILIMFTVSRLF